MGVEVKAKPPKFENVQIAKYINVLFCYYRGKEAIAFSINSWRVSCGFASKVVSSGPKAILMTDDILKSWKCFINFYY
jgi:hypothetical protein